MYVITIKASLGLLAVLGFPGPLGEWGVVYRNRVFSLSTPAIASDRLYGGRTLHPQG